MKTKPKPTTTGRARTYLIEPQANGRFYVYYLTFAPVQTLFDIKSTREEAEQAVQEHKAGKHSTQYNPE